MKILVLGAGGMAGHVVTIFLREQGFEVDTLSAHQRLDTSTYLIDVLDIRRFGAFLDANHYDVIINCIGLLIRESEKRRDLAVYVNSYFPRMLEQRYQDSSTKLVHISTDCVFSGLRAPYAENSPFDGQSFYDRSKALGEIANSKDLTFRMSIIGPELRQDGVGLFHWFMQQTGRISGYTHALWNGVTTIELARGIAAGIKEQLVGLYHLVPEKNISKYELLNIFKNEFNRRDVIIEPIDLPVVDKTLLNTRTDHTFNIPDYPTMVAEMREWIRRYSPLYSYLF